MQKIGENAFAIELTTGESDKAANHIYNLNRSEHSEKMDKFKIVALQYFPLPQILEFGHRMLQDPEKLKVLLAWHEKRHNFPELQPTL